MDWMGKIAVGSLVPFSASLRPISAFDTGDMAAKKHKRHKNDEPACVAPNRKNLRPSASVCGEESGVRVLANAATGM